ncbi:MAG: aminotransferase class I/II-fold pyridoxal phosphate-dependent enzyme [Magnetococcales bacterium]|nr:aminotransferase class I/II-fold pyridoxal phosphate-dependent enzyme [Magnetococcales bacterium]
MQWADKLSMIQPFYVMEVLAQVKALEGQGRDIVRFMVGEPEFATPQPVLNAGIQALEQDQTRYTDARGLASLRKQIAQWYDRQYGVSVPIHRIIVTPGTSGAFILAFGILLNPGDSVAITDPGYPCYPNIIRMLGGEPYLIPVGPESEYQLDAQLLKPAIEKGIRGVLITSPSNPTGTLIAPKVLKEVIELVGHSKGMVISDEIYHGITYGEQAQTALSFSDNVIVINGFSKFFAMTGWRLGWMIVPDEAVKAVEALAQNLFISAPTISQHAAQSVFGCQDQLLDQVAAYDRNRQVMIARLRNMGFIIAVEPRGAFYIYADATHVLKKTGLDDAQQLCTVILNDVGVAITPGLDFGQYRSNVHVRFSYAVGPERVEEGLMRLERFIQK